MVGSAVTGVVLPLVVYQITGSAAQTGALFAFRVVPYLLFGLVAGPIADRGNRRRLIIGGNLIEGTLVATIPIADLLGVLTIAQIYVVALLAATAFVFSDAAVFGAVPALVEPERLPAANGALSSLSSWGEIAGPVIAGLLAASIGATIVIWIDAASFFIAAAVLSSIRSTFRESGAKPEPTASLRSAVARAIRFIRGERTVATLLIVGFGNSFAFGTVLGYWCPTRSRNWGRRRRHEDRPVLRRTRRRQPDRRVDLRQAVSSGPCSRADPGSLAVSGTIVALLAVNTRWLVALIAIAVFSWSITMTIMVGITYRQLAAPDDLRSSVNVIGRMTAWGGQPFGAATGASIAALADVPTAYAVAAVVMLVASGGATAALRTGRSAPTRQPVEETERGL